MLYTAYRCRISVWCMREVPVPYMAMTPGIQEKSGCRLQGSYTALCTIHTHTTVHQLA